MKEAFPAGFASVRLDSDVTIPILVERVERFLNLDQRRVPPSWLLPVWDAAQQQRQITAINRTNALAAIVKSAADVDAPHELESAFRLSVFSGFVVGRSINPSVESLSFAIQQLTRQAASTVEADTHQATERTKKYLDEVADEAYAKMIGLDDVWDAVSSNQPKFGSEQIRPYSRLGFGMGALVYHEAAGHQLAQQTEKEIAALRELSDAAIMAAMTRDESSAG